MKKKIKSIISSLLLITVFALLSVINVYLIVKKHNSDMILLYSIACFFFIYWLCDLLFPVKFFELNYKLFRKPMSKSMTMDMMGIEVASEKKAYKCFQKMILIIPYIILFILGIGIIILLLL